MSDDLVPTFRRWLRLGPKTVAAPDLSSPCPHTWGNWTDPQPVAVGVYSPSYIGYGDRLDREGLFQDRKCLKCNLYERRLA